MPFSDKHYRTRLIDYGPSSTGFTHLRIASGLQELVDDGKFHIVPSTLNEGEPEQGTKLMLRHHMSGAYLSYSRFNYAETVDVLVPQKLARHFSPDILIIPLVLKFGKEHVRGFSIPAEYKTEQVPAIPSQQSE